MQQHLRIVFVSALLTSLASAQGAPCRKFARLLKDSGPQGIAKNVIYGHAKDGYEVYDGLDLDRDGHIDQVTKGCSASIVPADPCTLELKLTSGGKYEFVAWRMYLVAVSPSATGLRKLFRVEGSVEYYDRENLLPPASGA